MARDRWAGRYYFIMAAIGSAIGLGNVWRFPYITYKYGGGAFLIPWLIGLVVIGLPWFLVELGMGHWMQRGAPGAFEKIGKKWEWVGWWSVFTSFLLNTYYVCIMAWALCYLIGSFTLPWGTGVAAAGTAESYFYGQFLHITSGPGVLGTIQWPILATLAVSWIAIFLIIFKGAKIVGKVAVWTVTIPWACLVILAIRGLTLPGAVEGLNFYLTPNFALMKDPEVWLAAFSQIAFTLSLGMGIMYAYGSYIAKKADVTNNAFITSFANCATSFFAGFAVFSIVGYIMQTLACPIEEVAAESISLAFITWPVAISMMPTAPKVIGVIFFGGLWFLGIDSAFSIAEAAVTAIRDKWGLSKAKATGIICGLGFLMGILYTTGAGLYWLDIVDRAVAFYGLLITGIAACIVVGWVYGADKLRVHLNESSDIKIGKWFNWFVKLLVPIGLGFVVIGGGFIKDLTAPYGDYPPWAASMIWVILVVTLILSFVFQYFKSKKEEVKK
jgi:Na+-dependent transporters of the SNF family